MGFVATSSFIEDANLQPDDIPTSLSLVSLLSPSATTRSTSLPPSTVLRHLCPPPARHGPPRSPSRPSHLARRLPGCLGRPQHGPRRHLVLQPPRRVAPAAWCRRGRLHPNILLLHVAHVPQVLPRPPHGSLLGHVLRRRRLRGADRLRPDAREERSAARVADCLPRRGRLHHLDRHHRILRAPQRHQHGVVPQRKGTEARRGAHGA